MKLPIAHMTGPAAKSTSRSRPTPEEPLSRRVIFRLSEAELVALMEKVASSGLTMSGFLREYVRIDEIDVLPLDTGAKLVEEGEAMHHCVADYIEPCRDRDDLRIFSLRWNGERSTLRVARRANGWAVAENRSHCNTAPHAVLQRIGPKVALAYAALNGEPRGTR